MSDAPFTPVKVTIGCETFCCDTEEEYLRVMREKVTKPVLEFVLQFSQAARPPE